MGKRFDDLTTNMVRRLQAVYNASSLLSRASLLQTGLDPQGRNLDRECGYPEHNISVFTYRELYDREGVATRVVNVYPDECWSVYPVLYEDYGDRVTRFERKWKALLDNPETNPWHFLHRVDELSGIGHYGLLMLGLSDGKALDRPVTGVGRDGKPDGSEKDLDLLYLRAFSEDLVQVVDFEQDPTNPRFGRPTMYQVLLADPRDVTGSQAVVSVSPMSWTRIHWTRVVHVADNRKSSEVYGTPRMRPVVNRLFDVRKIAGGSGEMFWRGAFPGYSFETYPEFTSVAELDEDSVRQQFDDYANGLKRYLATTGMSVKSLAPQVSDPSNHLANQVMLICATIGVPVPIFLGSEQGHLASMQNTEAWNRRLSRRQNQYVWPMLIQPFVNRLIACGVLPQPKSYGATWNDLNSLSDKDKSTIALKKAQAVLQYVTSGSFAVVPPKRFLTEILGLTKDEAEAWIAEAGGESQVLKNLKDMLSAEAGNTAATTGTNPDKAKGAGGARNGLGPKKRKKGTP